MESTLKMLGSFAKWLNGALAGLGLLYAMQLTGAVKFGVEIIQPPTVDQLMDQAASYYPPAKKK